MQRKISKQLGYLKGTKDSYFKDLGVKIGHRCHSMQFDNKVHRYRFTSHCHRIASISMRFEIDAIRCESILIHSFIQLHQLASMPFFENSVFQIPVFSDFEFPPFAPSFRSVRFVRFVSSIDFASKSSQSSHSRDFLGV